MFKNLPSYYLKSNTVKLLGSIEKDNLDNLVKAIESTLNQFFIVTADDRLKDYEMQLKLPIHPNISIQERRARILAKLKGQDTTTIEVVKNIAKAYTEGNINIIEDNANYVFTVEFENGDLINLEDFKTSLDELKPCHLDYAIITSLMKSLKIFTKKVYIRAAYKRCGTIQVAATQKNTFRGEYI